MTRVTLALLALLAVPAAGQAVAEEDPDPLGRALFARHCAVCHGEDGGAEGSIPRRLRPTPRDFGSGDFRIVRTLNGAPTDEDLRGVLRRGMPGSAMPSFSWMSDAQIDALIAHVRRLAVDGLAESIAREVRWWEGRVLEPDAARRRAADRMAPGERVDATVPEDPDGSLRRRGRELYALKCQACHGPDGGGLGVEARWTDGVPVFARDFTAGVMKGGATVPDLIRRIRAGLPGTGMPPTTFDRPEDAAAVALHVRGLLLPGADDRLVQRRQEIVASRVERVPDEPSDPAWDGPETSIVLAPMAWSDDAVLEAAVAAVHDGEQLAVRVRWEDVTRDGDALRGARLPDAVALQWGADLQDPLFGMGSSNRPHDVWFWQAYRPEDVPGLLDLLEAGRLGGADVGPVGPHGPGPYGEALRAEGVDSDMVLAATAEELGTAADWRDGVWSVVLRRPLRVQGEAAVALAPGVHRAVAFGIWNGSARDTGLRKSITIWHEMVLAAD